MNTSLLFPADRAILAHRAHNITFVVPNLRKMIWGCRMMGLYSETGVCMRSA